MILPHYCFSFIFIIVSTPAPSPNPDSFPCGSIPWAETTIEFLSVIDDIINICAEPSVFEFLGVCHHDVLVGQHQILHFFLEMLCSSDQRYNISTFDVLDVFFSGEVLVLDAVVEPVLLLQSRGRFENITDYAGQLVLFLCHQPAILQPLMGYLLVKRLHVAAEPLDPGVLRADLLDFPADGTEIQKAPG